MKIEGILDNKANNIYLSFGFVCGMVRIGQLLKIL